MIAPNVVLTAAHCGSYNGKNVIVGAYEAGKTSNGAVSVKVTETKSHPSYDSGTERNDFALLKLESSVASLLPNTSIVFSINDDQDKPTDGQDLVVLGLGDTAEGGGADGAPDFLRDVTVQAISTDECNAQSSYNGQVDDDVMFCAGELSMMYHFGFVCVFPCSACILQCHFALFSFCFVWEEKGRSCLQLLNQNFSS